MLSVAGSDPSGGAGIQADLKTFAAHGVYGAAVISAITVQNSRGVTAVQPLEPELVGAQIQAVLSDLPVAAVKLGMLANAPVLSAVARGLRQLAPQVPVVIDPVLRSTSGRELLQAAALPELLGRLLPLATLLTPNLGELELLDGIEEPLALRCRRLGVALLVKGGHGRADLLEDRLLLPDGRQQRFSHRRVATGSSHGTGCVLSAAIAARLALGQELASAVQHSISWLQGLLRAGVSWRLGAGQGPLPVGLPQAPAPGLEPSAPDKAD